MSEELLNPENVKELKITIEATIGKVGGWVLGDGEFFQTEKEWRNSANDDFDCFILLEKSGTKFYKHIFYNPLNKKYLKTMEDEIKEGGDPDNLNEWYFNEFLRTSSTEIFDIETARKALGDTNGKVSVYNLRFNDGNFKFSDFTIWYLELTGGKEIKYNSPAEHPKFYEMLMQVLPPSQVQKIRINELKRKLNK
ncbi:hypothetical protein MCERE19_01100 [Spirosomataceae bacterium]|jgi:hypothetical protein